MYTNLERGVIDAAEWIGPYHDYIMGFHRIAKYYYAPGWHETGSLLENVFNMLEFNKLPNNLKVILETASARMNLWVLSEFESKNNIYLQKILDESDVKIKNFDVDVLSYLKSLSLEVTEELKDSDAFTKKVIENLESFKKSIKNWSSYSEALFYAIQ